MTAYVELDVACHPVPAAAPAAAAEERPREEKPRVVWRVCPVTNRPVMAWALAEPPHPVAGGSAEVVAKR